MKPNACVNSLNSNTRCRFPFCTLQPLSFRNSSAICCSESFAVAMSASLAVSRVEMLHSIAPGIIRLRREPGKRACVQGQVGSKPRPFISNPRSNPVERVARLLYRIRSQFREPNMRRPLTRAEQFFQATRGVRDGAHREEEDSRGAVRSW